MSTPAKTNEGGRRRRSAPDNRVALGALWAGLRLVVIDVETCQAADGDHIVSFAAVTCRNARITSTFAVPVNPGVPIDANTMKVHGITDDHVADEARFGSWEPRLSALLTPKDGERLVLVAHNVGFDVSRLHREYDRLGLLLPDVEILDSQHLPAAVGVRLPSTSLAALAAAMGVTNPRPHDAASDATTTAEAVQRLIEKAAADGETDFDALWRRATDGRAARTSGITPSAATGHPAGHDEPDERDEPVLPPEHLDSHTRILSARATPNVLARWRAAGTECATLRCGLLPDRVAAARQPEHVLRVELEQVLTERLGAGDRSGAATVLGSLASLLGSLPDRATALRWHDTWKPRLSALVGRCHVEDACPACRRRQPCPADTWHQPLARAALGPLTGKTQASKSFLHTSGASTGRGVFTTWQAAGRSRLADYAAYLVWLHLRDEGQYGRGELLAGYAWQAGGREPRLASIAAPGSAGHLQRGIDICDEALLSRQGSSDDAWPELLARRAQLQGRLTRLTTRFSDQLDEDGNPIPIRRHHPTEPRRTRPPRFSASSRPALAS